MSGTAKGHLLNELMKGVQDSARYNCYLGKNEE